MKLPSTLLGALAVALTGLATTGCTDLIPTTLRPKATPKPTSTSGQNQGGKGEAANNGDPDNCPAPGGKNPQAPCPGCGRG